MAVARSGKIAVRVPNEPRSLESVDAEKYELMKAAVLKVLPPDPPGMTQAQLAASVSPHVPRAHFPDAAKVLWWARCVVLDLEARGVLTRLAMTPTRWTK